MNGADFLEEVAKSETLAKVPIIVLTADVCASGMLGSRVALLEKPFQLERLFEMVESCGA